MTVRSEFRRSHLFAFAMPCSGLRHAFVAPSDRLRGRSCKALCLSYLRSDSPLDFILVGSRYCSCSGASRGSPALIRLRGSTVARAAGASEVVLHRVSDTHDWACVSVLCSRTTTAKCLSTCLSLCWQGLQFCPASTCEVPHPSRVSLPVAVGYLLDVVRESCLPLAAVAGMQRVRPDLLVIRRLAHWQRLNCASFCRLKSAPPRVEHGPIVVQVAVVVRDLTVGCGLLPKAQSAQKTNP